jgi:hypothetical protein
MKIIRSVFAPLVVFAAFLSMSAQAHKYEAGKYEMKGDHTIKKCKIECDDGTVSYSNADPCTAANNAGACSGKVVHGSGVVSPAIKSPSKAKK